MKRYGIFGGTFNPPHIAHSITAESVREQLKLDKIIFIPAGNPPLKESIDSLHRLAMASLAFVGNPGFEVSDIEFENRDEKSYTVNTLYMLNQIYAKEKIQLTLIIGVDNLIDFPNWKEPEKLFDLAEVVVINRPNYSAKDAKSEFSERVQFVSVPFLEISSSVIRENIRTGKSVRYMVCNEVEEYIIDKKLYL